MKRYDYDRICERILETPAGEYVRYEDAAELQRQLAEAHRAMADMKVAADRLLAASEELQRQLAEVTAERDEWKNTHDSGMAVYRDIGNALGADMPRELVNEVARRRMAELDAARGRIEELEMGRGDNLI